MSVREQVPVVGGPPPRIEVRNAAGSVAVKAVEGAEHLAVRVEALDDAAEQLLDRVEIDLRDGAAGSPARLRVDGARAAAAAHARVRRPRHYPARCRRPDRGRLGRRRADRPVGRASSSPAPAATSPSSRPATCTCARASGDVRVGAVSGRGRPRVGLRRHPRGPGAGGLQAADRLGRRRPIEQAAAAPSP